MASERDDPVTEKLEKKSTSNGEKGSVSTTLTPSSPYYLSPSDNPGTPLVAVALNGDNHRTWSRSMRTTLRAKVKLGFIDGTIKKPGAQSADYFNWERADSMVTAWIINSTDPALHGSISHGSTARDVWLDLEERFAQTNQPRIHQLWRMLCLMQKEDDLSVTEFYTKFKGIYDELNELQPLPECSCGASKELMKREEDQKVHLFLGSLDNQQFAHVKATILNTEPLPSLRKTFNTVLREEARYTAERERISNKPDAGAAFYSSASRQKWRDRSKEKCDHCGKTGHLKSGCFEIIGYPPNWDMRRMQRDKGRQAGHGTARSAAAGNQKMEFIEAGHALHGMRIRNDAVTSEGMTGNDEKTQWVLDSGASHHMTPLYSLLKEVQKIDKPFYITVPTGNAVLVENKGRLIFDNDIKLDNVLFIPEFSCNLISVHKLTHDLDCTVTYHSDFCVIQDRTTRKTIGSGDLLNGVYVLKEKMQGTSLAANQRDMTTLWHSRLGHPSSQALQHLSHLLRCNFNFNKIIGCDICHKSKQCRLPFPQSINKAEEPFSLIHSDLWGRYHTAAHDGSHYFLTIVDDYSRGTWVYLLKDKTQATGILMNFCKMVKTQFNRDVKTFRSDNGTEFTNSVFKAFLREKGIMHETSCVSTPQQNGRVERKHRHILNVARALRFHANLPIRFWGECVLAATHIINRTPTMANKGITPYEMLFGKSPNYDHIKVFGCLCYVATTSKQRDKFGPRADRCVFLGYPQGQKGWKVYNLKTREFIVSRDVVFYENVFPFKIDEREAVTDPPRNLFHNTPPRIENEISSEGEMAEENDSAAQVNIMEESCEVHVPQTEDNEEILNEKNHHQQTEAMIIMPPRDRKPPAYLQDFHCYAAEGGNDEDTIQDISDAIQSLGGPMTRARARRVNDALVHFMIKSIEGPAQVDEDLAQIEEKESKLKIIIQACDGGK
ncbi:unnamed protein product [Trifolium pratense]|uniref:Uncharacterized protein n=1 Tax=Trifolium pratense TaxID=57577 RepID=A0ACB0JZD9_TRIPR|nr:unnamed protein product [Trifolium pratense]